MSIKTNHEATSNYNEINNDYQGFRTINGNEEMVDYHEKTSHRIWLNDLNIDFPTHWHTALEIITPIDGNYELEIGGTRYTATPGDILVIPSGELHQIYAPNGGKRFIFMMNISAISKFKGFAGIGAILAHPLLINKEGYPLVYEDIYEILVQIRNEYFRNGEYTELIIQSLMINLLVKLGENRSNADELFPNVRLSKQKEYVERFNQILEYIDTHYMEDITLEDTAKMAGFSKFHFSRLFKQYTEFTFCDYLCYRRVKAAASMLAEPDYSVTEIAMNTGFPSISTFNRLFKSQMNCTPREYRTKMTSKRSNFS